MKVWREKNKEEKNSYNKKWRTDNPDWQSDWERNNKDARKDINHKFRNKNPLYHIWYNMKQRCYNQNNKDYKNYGQRGIAVCSEWLNKKGYLNFKRDLLATYKKGLTLDRKDNDGDYEPENCRWTTWEEQNNNKRNNIFNFQS